MTTFKITYMTIGNRKLDYVCISTSDYLNNGKKFQTLWMRLNLLKKLLKHGELLKTKTQL